ncbi:hypothetical protein E3J74_07790 [Candidatus Bathyarchaeota archaeon]|nr:MAG: hypothetical protein E3J74_07790 [Candidatus Bathyarchaeota archaeon]
MRNKELFQSFCRLIRLDYSLFSGLGVFLSGLLAGDLFGFQPEYLVAFLIVFLSAVGSFALNDYCDFEVDKRNDRSDRPLVSGLLSKELALITGSVSFFWVILLSFFLNLLAMVLVLASLALFFLYSLGLKKIFLVKNVLVAYAYVATIFLGALVSDGVLEPLIVYFALMGFIVGLAVEIMLDIGDIKGDKELGIDTLAARFGLKRAARFCVALYAVIMILDPLPFFELIDPRLYVDYVFLFLIFIPVFSYFFTSRSLIKDQSKNTVFQLKKRVFVTMQVGCIAYLIGVLI